MTSWMSHGRSRLVAGVPAGSPPGAPSNVTSVTKDSGATVSFLAPVSSGSGAITSWTVTPYIGASAQSPTTVSVGAAGSITGSNGNTYVQVPVTGLTNATAYTFTARASNSYGTGTESAASGANTPLQGLVFGDDFNGPANGPIDPEWYIYNRCGYIAQNEIEWYLPSQVTLDGSSNLLLTGVNTPHSGPSYPSDGNTTRNQTWISGACQGNTKSYAPSADGHTMTFEARQQICPGIAGGMWPGLFWLEGTDYQTAWKTDPAQTAWNTSGKAEIDIAEFGAPNAHVQASDYFLNNLATSQFNFIPDGDFGYTASVDLSLAMHVYSATWKGTSAQSTRAVNWYLDAPYTPGTGPVGGTNTATLSNNSAIPVQSASPFFLLLYLQIIAGSASSPQVCAIDYVRVYDENI